MIEITEQPIEVTAAIQAAQSEGAGAVNVFIGTVRNKTLDKQVKSLDYEVYDPMAKKEIQKIIDKAAEKWPILKAVVIHRKGHLEIGDAAVVIAISTPHRKASFEACEYIIDTLKQTVPIWKKEIFEGGEEWVSAHP